MIFLINVKRLFAVLLDSLFSHLEMFVFSLHYGSTDCSVPLFVKILVNRHHRPPPPHHYLFCFYIVSFCGDIGKQIASVWPVFSTFSLIYG